MAGFGYDDLRAADDRYAVAFPDATWHDPSVLCVKLAAYSCLLFTYSLIIGLCLYVDILSYTDGGKDHNEKTNRMQNWFGMYRSWFFFSLVVSMIGLYTFTFFAYFVGYLILEPEEAAGPAWQMCGSSFMIGVTVFGGFWTYKRCSKVT